ncbi:Rho GTPase-activating protein 1, partial [Mucuna pruriens]
MTEVLHFASSPPTTKTRTTSTTTTSTSSSSSSSSFSTHANAFLRPHLSLLALLLTLLRKSFLPRKNLMDIGSPTNVRHVAHVTFDRFNGFLGLPVEFEPEVPRRPPSASASVFGVSTESMQLSYDSRGNSVPTILLLMQRHLYAQGGLQVEGIFRINADNGQEEQVRDQLNLGVVPEGIDVHCLAGLIKAWFRELPTGILDPLSQEQVMQCQNEEECAELVRHLPHTEASLLDWAINLMADVVQHEHVNKMNARNIAMVFAPNMTQMADPISALMYAVQVMNFLKTLILRTVRERKDSVVEPYPRFHLEPFDDNGNHRLLESFQQETPTENEEAEENSVEKTAIECSPESLQNNLTGGESGSLTNSSEDLVCNEDLYCEFPRIGNTGKSKTGQSSSLILVHKAEWDCGVKS